MSRHDLDELVLLALLRLGDRAYGIAIRDELAEHGGREVTVGAIYKALWRLEAAGLVLSHTGEPTAIRGGRGKRVYRPSAAGRRTLQASVATMRRLTGAVKGLLPNE